MSQLRLDFASKQRDLTASNPALGFALLLAGLLALGVSVRDYQQQAHEMGSLQNQRDALHRRARSQSNDAPLPAAVTVQIEQANTAYALIQTPWEEILSALESVRAKSSGSIALFSVRADAARQELILTGEARNFAALNSFVSALSQLPVFQNVSLTDDKLSTGSPPVVVNFDLRLNWRGNAP